MRTAGLLLFSLIFFFQNEGITQSDNKYALKIEQLLDFKKVELEDTANASVIKKTINKNLDTRIEKAQKLKRDPDSISTKTISLLSNTKLMVNDLNIASLSSLGLVLIEYERLTTNSYEEMKRSMESLNQLGRFLKKRLIK